MNFSVPSAWHELSDRQLLYVYSLIALCATPDELRLLCLLRWNNARVLARPSAGTYLIECRSHNRSCPSAINSQLVKATTLQFAELLPALHWLTEMPNRPVHLCKIQRAHALPADFEGVPFQTYIIADNLYQGYLNTQSDALLDQLAAVLYDRPFRISPAHRISIFFWFASLKTFLANKYPDFLQPVNTTNSDNLLGSSQPSVEEAMNVQIRALTHGDITKEQTILQLDTHRALTELNAQAREYRTLQQQSKNP